MSKDNKEWLGAFIVILMYYVVRHILGIRVNSILYWLVSLGFIGLAFFVNSYIESHA